MVGENWDCKGVGNCVGVENWAAAANGCIACSGGGGSALFDALGRLVLLTWTCVWLPFADPIFPPLIPLAILDSGAPELELLPLRCRRYGASGLDSPSRRASRPRWSCRRIYSAIASASFSRMRDATPDSIVPSLVDAEPLRKRLGSKGSKVDSIGSVNMSSPMAVRTTHQEVFRYIRHIPVPPSPQISDGCCGASLSASC
jgi:hypothetical protein